RNEQRPGLVHGVRRRIGQDRVPRARKARLDRPRHVGGETREHQVAVERRLGRLNHEAAHGIWRLARESPGARVGVGPALGPVGRRQRGDGELRMPLEQLQEALPDGPRRPENADPNLPHRRPLTHRMPAASIEHTYNRSARGDLPRIAATLNKVLKSDGPRRGMPGLFCFPKEQAMRASVTVRVAGSTSNLGAGFDCVGVAVGRWLRVTARTAPGKSIALERSGTLSTLETAPEADLLYRGFAAACRKTGREAPL